jgi:protein-disulfide isomerase
MKNPWTIIGVITVLLIAGSFWYSSTLTEKSNEGINITPHVKGNAEAAVVLLEYSDFECPACASFQPFLKDLMGEYGDRLKFEYKHFPLPMHKLAEPAARAAEAAGQQGAFFEFHDLLFENQKVWSVSVNPTVQFNQYAEQLDLDMDKFKQHYNSSLLRDRIKSDIAEARQLDVNATPTFFLNGEKMTFQTFEEFTNQIKQALEPQVQFELQ